MFKAAVLVVALVALAAAQQPARPDISADFEAEVNVETHDGTHHLFGRGKWAIDYTANKAVEDYEFEHEDHHDYLYNLERFDLKKAYTIRSEHDKHDCHEDELHGDHLENIWAFVANASYAGQHDVHGKKFDLWVAVIGGVHLGVGVDSVNTNTPVVFERIHGAQEFRVEFLYFNATTPESQIFDVPSICTHTLKDPARPEIAESFLAHFERRSEPHNEEGEGVLASAEHTPAFTEAGKNRGDRGEIEFLELLRFDLKKEYFIDSHNKSDCHERATQGKYEPIWGWVAEAKYEGHHNVGPRNASLDIWGFEAGGVRLAVGVSETDPNVPVFLGRESSSFREEYHFVNFTAGVPDAKYFKVPAECQQ